MWECPSASLSPTNQLGGEALLGLSASPPGLPARPLFSGEGIRCSVSRPRPPSLAAPLATVGWGGASRPLGLALARLAMGCGPTPPVTTPSFGLILRGSPLEGKRRPASWPRPRALARGPGGWGAATFFRPRSPRPESPVCQWGAIGKAQLGFSASPSSFCQRALHSGEARRCSTEVTASPSLAGRSVRVRVHWQWEGRAVTVFGLSASLWKGGCSSTVVGLALPHFQPSNLWTRSAAQPQTC